MEPNNVLEEEKEEEREGINGWSGGGEGERRGKRPCFYVRIQIPSQSEYLLLSLFILTTFQSVPGLAIRLKTTTKHQTKHPPLHCCFLSIPAFYNRWGQRCIRT